MHASVKLRLALYGALFAGTLSAVWFLMIRMPGTSHRGPLPPLDAAGRALAAQLERDVRVLAEEIGERNHANPESLARAADWIEGELEAAGLTVRRESFAAGGQNFANLVAEVGGSPRSGELVVEPEPGARAEEIVVVGAHYDSVVGSPGANDNASGVAALLALARGFAGTRPARILQLVAFANEEPPWFQSDSMGSLVHARGCRARGENVVAMISLETIGYYSDGEKSQSYPLSGLGWIYPKTADFIAFVGNIGSRALVRRAVASFRGQAAFPCEGAAMPAAVPGIGWSDHWAYWQQGYSALMVTDTAPFRYPWYHTGDDTPDKLDYGRMARVVAGVRAVVGAELTLH